MTPHVQAAKCSSIGCKLESNSQNMLCYLFDSSINSSVVYLRQFLGAALISESS
uniref:Uncharacterized protein n=1 Tax=Aegilops tauschii subsp. strangulata TaxID=200361 RepID=A0A452ZHJ2_AEGTS